MPYIIQKNLQQQFGHLIIEKISMIDIAKKDCIKKVCKPFRKHEKYTTDFEMGKMFLLTNKMTGITSRSNRMLNSQRKTIKKYARNKSRRKVRDH